MWEENENRENHSLPDGTYVTYYPESETVYAINYDTGEEWHFDEDSAERVRELADTCLCKEEFASYYQNEDDAEDSKIKVLVKTIGQDKRFDVRFALQAFSDDAGRIYEELEEERDTEPAREYRGA